MIKTCITWGWFHSKGVHAYGPENFGFTMLCGLEPVEGHRHYCPEPAKLSDVTCTVCRQRMSERLIADLDKAHHEARVEINRLKGRLDGAETEIDLLRDTALRTASKVSGYDFAVIAAALTEKDKKSVRKR